MAVCGLWLLSYSSSNSCLHRNRQIHERLEQAPVLGWRQRLHQSIAQLRVRLDEDGHGADLLVFGPRLAQSFERSTDVFGSAVGAGILNPLDHNSVVLACW